jgi:hypothetical protein
MELSLTFATAGLIALGGLALVMGAAVSSLAELLALLPRRGGWAGSEMSSRGYPCCHPVCVGPMAGVTMAASPAGERDERMFRSEA